MDAPHVASNVPERSPEQSGSGAEVVDAQKIERMDAQAAPSAAERARNNPTRDDGVAGAQAQVASVTADDAAAAGSTNDPAAASATPLPATAADVDVLEPEWVKKAEEAVAKNRDNPHDEEEAVEDIQRDYLKKRYNLDVKSSDESS